MLASSFHLGVDICYILGEKWCPDEIIISNETSSNDFSNFSVGPFNHPIRSGAIWVGWDEANSVGVSICEEGVVVEFPVSLNDVWDGIIQIHDILKVSPYGRQSLVRHAPRKYFPTEVVHYRKNPSPHMVGWRSISIHIDHINSPAFVRYFGLDRLVHSGSAWNTCYLIIALSS